MFVCSKQRFVARDVRSACNEFRFEGQLVTNVSLHTCTHTHTVCEVKSCSLVRLISDLQQMTDFLHSFCKRCNAAHLRPYEKHRRAVIVW